MAGGKFPRDLIGLVRARADRRKTEWILCAGSCLITGASNPSYTRVICLRGNLLPVWMTNRAGGPVSKDGEHVCARARQRRVAMKRHANLTALQTITHISVLPHFLMGNSKNVIDLHALFNYSYWILCIFSKKVTACAFPGRQTSSALSSHPRGKLSNDQSWASSAYCWPFYLTHEFLLQETERIVERYNDK